MTEPDELTPDGRAIRLTPEGALYAEHPLAAAPGAPSCATFWGSHGCDLFVGHDGPCICGATDPDGLCSTYERGVGVRFYDGAELGEPMSEFTGRGDKGDQP